MEKTHEAAQRLYEAILKIRDMEECKAFFEDICTIREIQDISQRFEVAPMLLDGKNYQTVSKGTGASTATICRVSKCLNYGSGGYKTILSRTEKSEEEENA